MLSPVLPIVDLATAIAGSKSQSSASVGSEDDVVDDVVVPPDLPLKAIAEEVQNSWHLKVCSSTMAHASLCGSPSDSMTYFLSVLLVKQSNMRTQLC